MPPVLAKVGGDAVCPSFDGQVRGAHGIGMTPPPRITNGGDVVNIHA
jgi:hypothetical protein